MVLWYQKIDFVKQSLYSEANSLSTVQEIAVFIPASGL
jgi:hypothetical protein